MGVDDIATLAAGLHTKPTKERVFESLKTLIGRTNPNTDTDGFETEVLLADLYAYFLPKITKPKTVERWVGLAVAKQDVRDFLMHLYCDGKQLIATDGHRLHLMRVCDQCVGYYDTNLSRISTVTHAYPNINKVISGRGSAIPIRAMINVAKVVEARGPSNWSSKWVYKIKIKGHVMGFSKLYIDQALSFFPDVKCYYISSNTVLRFENEKQLAVVMPIIL